MKRILITGAGSYIGTSFEAYIKSNFSNLYTITVADMLDGRWREMDFSGFDVVYHVAGIAHSDKGALSDEEKRLYRVVNTELAIETAKKAKAEGVRQFVFMSSAIVYGNSAPIGKQKHITRQTPPAPANVYGESKLLAENGILPLADEGFKVVILRAPMIYGKGCKGNFPSLEKLAERLCVFPYVKNKRSMLYIGNLVEFVRLMIENEESGMFWPQNAEYVNTSEMVALIAKAKGKKLRPIKGVQWMLRILGVFVHVVNKAFGNLSYDMSLSEYREDYRKYDLAQSIEETERG